MDEHENDRGADESSGRELVEWLAVGLSRLLAEVMLLLLVYVILIGVVTFLAVSPNWEFFAVAHFVPGALILVYGFARWRRLLLHRPQRVDMAPGPQAEHRPATPRMAITERRPPRVAVRLEPDLTPAADLRHLMDVFTELDDAARSSLIGEANRLLDRDESNGGG